MIKNFDDPRFEKKGTSNLSLLSLETWIYRVDWIRKPRENQKQHSTSEKKIKTEVAESS